MDIKNSLVITHALWNLFHLEKGIKRLKSEVQEEMEGIRAFDSEKVSLLDAFFINLELTIKRPKLM